MSREFEPDEDWSFRGDDIVRTLRPERVELRFIDKQRLKRAGLGDCTMQRNGYEMNAEGHIVGDAPDYVLLRRLKPIAFGKTAEVAIQRAIFAWGKR